MSVQTEIDRLNAIKARIRTNLVAQGIEVPEDTMLEEMAAQILSVAGEDGKSAYEYAQDAGYTGTEEEFAAKMADVPTTEEWTFTLEDGSTVTKVVYVG